MPAETPTTHDELLNALAPGLLPEQLAEWPRIRNVLPVFDLAHSLFYNSAADTALKLIVLLNLARVEGRFGRERIRSLVPALDPTKLDAIITALYRGGWLELRALDNTYRLKPLGLYLLSVLLAADFGSQNPANLLIRAVETIAYGDRIDDSGSTTGQLLAMLLAELETQAATAREIIGHGTPRQLIRFSREEVRQQVRHVVQVLAAIEERMDESSEHFARLVRIHASLQDILRAHEGLARRLAEWNLKRLETSDAGYSLAALSDAVMGASDEELLALLGSGCLRPNAPARHLSTERLLTRHRSARPSMAKERERFVYQAPLEPELDALALAEVDPVTRLAELLAAALAQADGAPVDLTNLLAERAEDFADAVYLLNLLARIRGRELGPDLELAPGLRARITGTAVESAALEGLDAAQALQKLIALGALVPTGHKGLHSALTLEPGEEQA